MNFILKDNDQFLVTAYKEYLKNTPDMVFVKDTDLVYRAASDAFARRVGFQCGEDIINKTDFECFDRELARKYTKDDRNILSKGKNELSYIEPIPDNHGKRSYSSTSKYIIRDESGNVTGLYGIGIDVTAQVELEKERESSLLSRQMFDGVIEADITEDKLMKIEGSDWIPTMDITSQHSYSYIIAMLASSLIHTDYETEFRNSYDLQKLKENYKSGIYEFSHVTYVRMKNGDYKWTECKSRIYHSRVSDSLRITTFLKDVNEEVCYTAQLRKRAVTDALTGLNNRESVMESISANLKEDDSDGIRALFFIDLDHFKQVNDSFGHQYGDIVLKKTAERMKEIFGETHIYGRIGGDEFVVFLRNMPSLQAVNQMAETAITKLSFCQEKNDQCIQVTCSIGITFCQGRPVTVEKLFEQADMAMYKAKEMGRNQISFFDESN